MMKNPNTKSARLKRGLLARWSIQDHPGAEPRFHWKPLAKDVAIFILMPIGAILFYKSIDGSGGTKRRPNPIQQNRDAGRMEASRSQIIDFGSGKATSPLAGIARRSPGSLVRVKLLNVVETYSTAPVHAQIIDAGLGQNLMGGSLIGDAVPDTNFERITITFKFARDPNRDNIAVPISARALGLDGTLGLVATKKEGFVTRSALGSAGTVSQELQGKSSSTDFKDILLRALTAGLVQEFGSESQVEKNRAQVLTLAPGTDFYVELTDFFPGAGK